VRHASGVTSPTGFSEFFFVNGRNFDGQNYNTVDKFEIVLKANGWLGNERLSLFLELSGIKRERPDNRSGLFTHSALRTSAASTSLR
jgi:hypothetical protein